MWVSHSHFRSFRNYSDVALIWSPHQNLFLGENAAGKTNVLEAIYFLSHGRSYRTRHDRELIQWDHPFATLSVTAQSHQHGGTLQIEAQLTQTPERGFKAVFKLNGQAVKSRSQIVGKIPTVTFFLSDLAMVRGVPEDRRTAVDSCLVQYDPAHFKRLALYQRVRQQKSQFLKQCLQTGVRADVSVLMSLNEQVADAGAEVMWARLQYLQQIESLAELRYHELSQGREQLSMAYQPSFSQPLAMTTKETLRDQLLAAIEAVSGDEQRRGQVLVGPHRDDIRFCLSGQDACLYGSQGQQRSIVLAFKLAEIQILKQALHEESPVLLLDDVMAELDPLRQSQLLAHLDPKMQVILSTTHLDAGLEAFLSQSVSAQAFHVVQGQITPKPLSQFTQPSHQPMVSSEVPHV